MNRLVAEINHKGGNRASFAHGCKCSCNDSMDSDECMSLKTVFFCCFFWLCRSVVVVGVFDEQEAIFARGGTRAIAVVAEVSGCPLKERKRSPLPEGCGDNVV